MSTLNPLSPTPYGDRTLQSLSLDFWDPVRLVGLPTPVVHPRFYTLVPFGMYILVPVTDTQSEPPSSSVVEVSDGCREEDVTVRDVCLPPRRLSRSRNSSKSRRLVVERDMCLLPRQKSLDHSSADVLNMGS